MAIQRKSGEFHLSATVGEQVRAYIPRSLPPDPPIDLSELYPLLDKANQALGRLDGSISILPDLQKLGIVHEGTGRRRNRVFYYQACLDLIGTGTEPLP